MVMAETFFSSEGLTIFLRTNIMEIFELFRVPHKTVLHRFESLDHVFAARLVKSVRDLSPVMDVAFEYLFWHTLLLAGFVSNL